MSAEDQALENDDMLPEYDFSEGIRGKHYSAYRQGHTVEAPQADGTRDPEYTEGDARWDALLATDASQRLLEKLADEGLAEIEAGKSSPMIFTEDGEIASE